MNFLNDQDWQDLNGQARNQAGLDDEVWEQMRKAAAEIQSKITNDLFFGTRTGYSSNLSSASKSVNTGRTMPSVGFMCPMRVVAFEPNIPIIISDYMTEKVKSYRKRKKTFSEWFWSSLSFHPYTPVELYEEEVPSAAWVNGKVVCHPALADAFRKAIG